MPSDTLLHKAAGKGNLEECKHYLESYVNEEDPDEKFTVNDSGAAERTPLHRSAVGGFLEICVYFVDVGAEIDIGDKSKRTPLHCASIAGHTDCVKYLLSKGANILAETQSLTNPLHCSVEANKIEVTKILLEQVKEDQEKKLLLLAHKNSEGKTPWEIAYQNKNREICQVLKDNGDPNAASASCCIS